MKKPFYTCLCALALLWSTACEDPYKGVSFTLAEEQPIGLWLADQAEFSLWVEMLQKADIFNAINLGVTEYTCFVADNSAVKAWLSQKGYAKVADIPQEEVDLLMRYHVIAGNVLKASDMLLKLPTPTVSGDYLTAGVDTQTEVRYIDNGSGKARSSIVTKDLEMSNGIIQQIDNLLQPIVETLWDLLSENPEGRYSIFAQAVAAAGYDSFLDRSTLTYEDYTYKDNKTVFAVPDSIYHLHGIESFADLCSRFDGDPAQEDSPFHQYVLYHFMHNLNSYAELTTFHEDGKSMILYTLSSRKGLSILDSANVVWLNPHEECFNIMEGHRDIPAQNGYLHEVNGLMVLPSRMAHYTVVWEPTEAPEFRRIPFYRSQKTTSAAPEKYELDPEEPIANIHWYSVPRTAGKVWYNSQNIEDRFWNHDALFWSLGSIGSMELTLPVLPMGKYRMYCIKINDNANGGKFHVYWDTEQMMSDANFKNADARATWGGVRNLLAEERHVLRFVCGSLAGWGGIDRLIFLPQE